MFDPLNGALRAASVHSAWAIPIVFATGALSSVGPCVAPRFIAAAGLTGGRARRESSIVMLSFISGLVVAYAGFGAAASLVGKAAQFSTYIYYALATALAFAGGAALWGTAETHRCIHFKVRRSTGIGASFLLGASFALVVSPCCTPVVIAILAYTSASGDALYGSTLLAVFAVGHALPLLGVGFGVQQLGELLAGPRLRAAASTASATLMLSLAAYYAVLA